MSLQGPSSHSVGDHNAGNDNGVQSLVLERVPGEIQVPRQRTARVPSVAGLLGPNRHASETAIMLSARQPPGRDRASSGGGPMPFVRGRESGCPKGSRSLEPG